ncbi:MAG TPA: hypothetical protein VHT73_19595 [Thermodesulfobacteriota bacterium]|nr:hypothetical protein [Thermodesulfobacteriota bacterium]
MKHIWIITLTLIAFFSVSGKSEEVQTTNPVIQRPEQYIKITDWYVYGTWSAVAIIHHVTIENTSDIAYKDIKVRVFYTSTSTSQQGIVISQETGVLPITLPPHSKGTYLQKGTTLGVASQFMNPSRIQVLAATPVD